MKVLAALHLDGPTHGAQPGCQRNGPKIVDRHVAGERNNPFLAIHLAHGFVQYGRDDAAMNMAGGSLKAARHAKLARDTAIVRGVLKAQVQSISIFLGTAEAVMHQPRDGPIERVSGTGSRLPWMCVRRGRQSVSILLF